MELLVVILIILVVSAIALPTVLPAISHRQVGEAARILQGALVGARDAAIHANAPAGIRLLPDPALVQRLKDAQGAFNGPIDPTAVLACNRIVPIAPAPEYTEGLVNVNRAEPSQFDLVPYPGPGGGSYSIANLDGPRGNGFVLMLEESVADPQTGVANSPTSWWWNIRVGDRVQVGGAGPWYTVVGPMTIPNPEGFTNVGPPGTPSPLQRGPQNARLFPEFLFLVNGRDDNGNGWVDEGWDGVDNNGVDGVDELAEWIPPPYFDRVLNTMITPSPEAETWQGALAAAGIRNAPYIIRRRPAPSPNAREVALPGDVVVDLTTWANPTLERSRVPAGAFNTHSGSVDILVNPDGSVVPTTLYSSPSSVGLAGAFYHLWLAERGDLVAPSGSTLPTLPLPKGEYRLVTLFARTGRIATAENPPFRDANGNYSAGNPYVAAQQGVADR